MYVQELSEISKDNCSRTSSIVIGLSESVMMDNTNEIAIALNIVTIAFDLVDVPIRSIEGQDDLFIFCMSQFLVSLKHSLSASRVHNFGHLMTIYPVLWVAYSRAIYVKPFSLRIALFSYLFTSKRNKQVIMSSISLSYLAFLFLMVNSC